MYKNDNYALCLIQIRCQCINWPFITHDRSVNSAEMSLKRDIITWETQKSISQWKMFHIIVHQLLLESNILVCGVTTSMDLATKT